MALFPSCSAKALFPSIQEEPSTNRDKDHSWLDNTSFKQSSVAPTPAAPSSPLPPEAKRKKKHHKDHVKHKKAKSDSTPAKPNTIWLEDSGLETKDAYRVDSNPDAGNLQYSGLYSGDVALYKRRFGARCIGQPEDMKMEWTDGRGKSFKGKNTKPSSSRYFSGDLSKEVILQPTCTQALQSDTNEPLDFIAFKQELPDKTAEDSGTSNELTAEKYISQQTAEYNRGLLEDPHNVQLWLEFVSFQDSARLWSGKGTDSKNARALLERKIAILERALESNPTSEDLLVHHMGLVSRIWEYATTMKKWKDIVFRHPNKPRLWLNYIQFCQSNFSTFSASSLISLFAKSITTLTSIQEGSLKSHKPVKDTPKYLLAIFSLCCNFLRQLGQTEKAVASYQALIEFNLCSPPELDASDLTTKSRLEFFEAFWDSGLPRFGEHGAPGWANWTQQAQSSTSSGRACLGLLDNTPLMPEVGCEESEVDPEIEMVADLPLDQAWLKLESHRSSEQCLPWRPGPDQSEDDCIDPDRMVLFDDVKQYMFRIMDPALQFELVLGFLHFLGAAGITSSPLLSCTPTLVSQCLEQPGEVFAFDTVSLDSLHSNLQQPVHCRYQSLGYCIGYKALPSGSVLELATSVLQPESNANPAVCNLVSNICNQSLSVLSDPSSQTSVAEVWITSQLSQLLTTEPLCKEKKARVKSLQKLVKHLLQLSQFHSSLRLWNCCALLEHITGNYSDAIKIYRTVLTQYSGVIVPDITLLYRCMCECLICLQPSLHGSPPDSMSQEALNVLVCFTEGKFSPLQGSKVAPSRILRARSRFDQDESSHRDSNYVLCHALFEYITSNLQSACAVLDKAVEWLTSTSSLADLETLYCWQTRLISHHSVIQPAMLRKILQNALTLFPENSWFLNAFIESEQEAFISGRLRRYFDSKAPSAVTAMPWLCAIRSELKRYTRLYKVQYAGESVSECIDEPVTGTVHRIRALLARATDSESGRLCPLLWRLRMAIEQDAKQVKAVFYQAIQQCPSAKMLYCDVVSLVPDELTKVVEMLEEKELRVRAPLEEVKLLLTA